MNNYTLQFESKQIEKEYNKAQLKTLQQNISLVSFYYFFTALQAMILRSIENDNPYYFMLALHLGTTIIIVGLLNYVAWKYPKLITPLCQIFSLVHTFVNVIMIKRQKRITPYLAIYSFLFMLIHMRFTQHFLVAFIVIIAEHIFMIGFLFGSGFEYDRFCTYMILSLIIYLLTEFQREKQRRKDFLEGQLNLKSAKAWKFIMLEIQPQITALISIKKVGNLLQWQLKEINKIGQDEFQLDDEEKFVDFLSVVKIESSDDSMEEKNLEKNLIDEINQYLKINFKADTILKRSDTYFQQDSSIPPLILFGYYQNYKFKIIIAKFFYLNEPVIFLKLENFSWQDEIKKLKELDQYKDRLLATVSHDLRTPLIGINFNFDSIKPAEQSCEEVEKYKAQGKANSDLLMSYINDILDYCQMKEQKIRLNLSKFNLIKLLQEAVDLLNIPGRLKGINITLKNLLSSENTFDIYSDEQRIKQIIINLLSNSLKFTKKGGKIDLIVRNQKNDQYKIEVVDTGAGIKKEIIPELAKPYATFGNFPMFFYIKKKDNGDQMNKQGIGLGLSICKKLIGLLGPSSELFISSEFGKGAKFGFLLNKNCSEGKQYIYQTKLIKELMNQECLHERIKPQANQSIMSEQIQLLNSQENMDESQVFSEFKLTGRSMEEGVENICVELKSNHQIQQQQFSSKTHIQYNSCIKTEQSISTQNTRINILLADDNPFNILVLEGYLKKMKEWHFKIQTANNGQEVLDIFKEQNETKTNKNIDIIILDCDMPIIDGFQAAQNIQQLVKENNFVQTDIVGYTCYEGDQTKCLRYGMNRFLQKPATEQQFTVFIGEIFTQIKIN